MIETFVALCIASFVFLIWPQTRWVGAVGTIVIIVLQPILFLVAAALFGTIFAIFKTKK